MRKLIRLIVALIVLIVIGLVAAYFYIDYIAQQAVERGGSFALGVDTTVKSARVGILDGQLKLRGLNVANPEGFDSEHFLNLGKGTLEVSLFTLTDRVVEVPLFRLADLDLNLERREGKTNYKTILENLRRFESNEEKSPDDDPKRFIVDRIVIRNTTAHVDYLPAGGELTRIDLPIENIRMRDVGRDQDPPGHTIGELSDIIVKAVVASLIEQGGDLLPPDLVNDLRSELATLQSLDALGIDLEAELPENIGEILREQNLGDILGEDVGGRLENILGGSDEDDNEQ